MILQALVKYYENLAEQGKVSRPGWCHEKVSYEINLSKTGEVLGITSRKVEDIRGKKTIWVPAYVEVPERVHRSGYEIAANFLCDNAKYLMGIDQDNKPQRVLECFKKTREKHLDILQSTQGKVAQAVLNYFNNWDPTISVENPVIRENFDKLIEKSNLIFCVEGQEVQEDPEIQSCWDNYRKQSAEDIKGICLVTGEKTEISRTHKMIKGIPGAQSSGASLISFNALAFESYERKQSYNAPVGKYAEFAYTTALNYLLSQRDYTFSLGDSMIVYWAESGREQYQRCFSNMFRPTKDNQKKLKDIFDSLKEDTKIYLEDAEMDPKQNFYILALAPNAARLSVRFFYVNSFGKIIQNIADHYERLEIVKPAREEQDYLGIRDMLNETVNQKSKDKTPVPNMAALVLQAILSGGRYPASLYANTLIRIRAECGNVNWKRAAIIKAVLIKNYNCMEGEAFMESNDDCKDVPYILGKLFCVLEEVQWEASNRKIKTTIRDSYFNSACATPAMIFPVLLKLKNSHMKKLERDKIGLKVDLEKKIACLMEKLPPKLPERLTLQEQGEFNIGYYHQQQEKYKKGEDK